MDFTHINPLWEAVKLTVAVALPLGVGGWLIRRLKKPVMDLIWCVLIGAVLLFTISAWIWSVAKAGQL